MKYQRGKSTKGVASRDMIHFSKLVDSIIKEQGFITAKNLLKTNAEFLLKYLAIENPRDILKEKRAGELIKSLYQDSHPAFVYDTITRAYLPFEKVYKDQEQYRLKYSLRYLRSALKFQSEERKAIINNWIEEDQNNAVNAVL